MIEPLPMKLPSHDDLSRLARDDPQSFELLRHELIENRINRAPEKIRHRLRLLQFRVDGIRRLAGSPLGATLKIQALMWDYFLQMNESLQGLFRLSEERPHLAVAGIKTKQPTAKSARIIEFKPRSAITPGARTAESKR